MTELLNTLPDSGPEVRSAQTDAPGTFRGRLLYGLQSAGNEAFSLMDLSAGISLARSDAKVGNEAMATLDARYGGLLERQTAPDVVSTALDAAIVAGFRRDAYGAGYLYTDTMPADARRQAAETSAQEHFDDLTAELQTHHPDWSAEQLAEAAAVRAQDVITLLAMTAEQRDTYRAAVFEYQERGRAAEAAHAEAEALHLERHARVARIGRLATQTVVAFTGKVRTAPYAIGAHASVTGMRIREWYGNRSPEGKKAVILSAASVALSGLAAYAALRFANGGDHEHMILAGNNGNSGGNTVPDTIGGAPSVPNRIGVAPSVPDQIGMTPQVPKNIGDAPVVPNRIGGNAVTVPDQIGRAPQVPDTIGAPNTVPTPSGGNLSRVTSSKELFVQTGKVSQWPETITVSKWDAKNHDGSLWGISEAILRGSGVDHPENDQIAALEHTLRSQALGPDGRLQAGQKLHLKPALDALRRLK